jgi:hypothetical protein
MLQIVASLKFTYDCNVFIEQATVLYMCQPYPSRVVNYAPNCGDCNMITVKATDFFLSFPQETGSTS